MWSVVLTSACGAVFGIVASCFAAAAKEGFGKSRAMRQGVQSLLRAEILRAHEKYMAQGWCPAYAKDALRVTYDAYHRLGKNGVMTKFYNDLLELPERQMPKKENNLCRN